MRQILIISLLLSGGAILFQGCKKDKDDNQPVSRGSVSFRINYKVDGQPLIFDSILYINEAGNYYSVSRIYYYITDITLHKPDGSSYNSGNVQFIDARRDSTNNFSIVEVPVGSYSSISFNIGVDSIRNVMNGLAFTADNLSMEWPESMGGGYHFLRLEGYFTDSTLTPGYAMHIGQNACLIKVQNPVTLEITNGGNPTSDLSMNVNEWFKNPNVYDFNTDGNYSMGNMPAMLKLSQNGTDVFNQ